MEINNNITCPVDNAVVDEHRVRIGAFFIIILAAAYLFTSSWVIPAFLLIDFALRAWGANTYSIISQLSKWIALLLKIKSKPVNRGPKRFAAATGTVFSGIILLCHLVALPLAAKSFTVVLVLFASLESFAGFCAGCYVYTLIQPLKRK